MRQWLELSVQVDREAVDSVAEVFSRYVYGGVAIEESITTYGDREGYQVNPTEPVTIRGYLPLDDSCGGMVTKIKEALDHLSFLRPIGDLTLRSLAEEDWANAWKEHFQVLKVGRRTVVVPSWHQYSPQDQEITIILDPGMAFGTGLHPTTRLCLVALEDYLRPGCRVLDLGTGSGILAIAAARLGAASVLALDTDAVAVEVAQRNVIANGLANTVRVAQGTLPQEREGPWDLVVANIIAQVIIALAGHLATAVTADGLLIVSGIIQERATAVESSLLAQGLAIVDKRADGDWLAYVARHR